MKVILYRYRRDLFGVHGQIEFPDGKVLCYTIERHDDKICPAGTYQCEPHVKSNNKQLCWILKDVPGRTGILIHTGNTEGDSTGCIIIGLMTNAEGVLESRMALDELHAKLPSIFTLEIVPEP